MKCPDREALQAYVDGEVAEDAWSAVTDHVSGCEACKATLDDIQQAQGIFARMAEAWRQAPDLALEPEAGDAHMTDDEVAEFVAGCATDEDARRFRSHISRCSRCLHEVAVTTKIAAALADEDYETARQLQDEQLRAGALAQPAPKPAPEAGPPIGARVLDSLRLAWNLAIPVLRPATVSVPAMAADQLVETRATADGAVQVSIEVRLPDQGLVEGQDVPVAIHILVAPDRPELTDIAFACKLIEGPAVIWEATVSLAGRRGSVETVVPRPKGQAYQIAVEPVNPA